MSCTRLQRFAGDADTADGDAPVAGGLEGAEIPDREADQGHQAVAEGRGLGPHPLRHQVVRAEDRGGRKEEDEEVQYGDAPAQPVGTIERSMGALAKYSKGGVLRLVGLQHTHPVDALLDVRGQGAVGEPRSRASLPEAGRESPGGQNRGDGRDQEQQAEVRLEETDRDEGDDKVDECRGRLDQRVLHDGGHHGAVLVDAVDRIAHGRLVVIAQRQVHGAIHHGKAKVLIDPLQDPGEVVSQSGAEQEAAGRQGAGDHEEHRSQREPRRFVQGFDIDEPRRIQTHQTCLGGRQGIAQEHLVGQEIEEHQRRGEFEQHGDAREHREHDEVLEFRQQVPPGAPQRGT